MKTFIKTLIFVTMGTVLFSQKIEKEEPEKFISIDQQTGMKIYWTDNQIYDFAKKYSLQDSLFENPYTIKKNYTLLRCYPKVELEKYFISKTNTIKRRNEWRLYQEETENFHKESKLIKSSKEYLALLNKYPRYKAELLKFLRKDDDYLNFEKKLVSGEIRVGRMISNGDVVLIPEKFDEKNDKNITLPIQ